VVQYKDSLYFMSDHALVSFNMFEEWNEKSVVLHISFVSFVINN